MPYTQAISETRKKKQFAHMMGEQVEVPEMTVR